jgi:undecaprenyl diphosphate synthase
MKNNVRLNAIGRLYELPESCQQALSDAIAQTAGNTATTLILALNYSGRAEIIDAVKALTSDALEGKLAIGDIDSNTLSSRLYTKDYPDPDLLIRTSGEMRLSNFLLWQLSYTEIYVTDKLWPDFGKPELRAALADFATRQRRYGGL